MTCCKSTSAGVGAPTTAPSNNDPDIYIEHPSGQIWVWTGTQWTKPPVGATSYNETTRELTVGSSTAVLPVASTTGYGVVKLADPASDPNSPIVARPDGTIGIDCTKLVTHCSLATVSDLNNKPVAHGATLEGAGTTQAPLGVKISSSPGNIITSKADGLYAEVVLPSKEELAQMTRDSYRITYGNGLVEIGGSTTLYFSKPDGSWYNISNFDRDPDGYLCGSTGDHATVVHTNLIKHNEAVQYKEAIKRIPLAELGLSRVISASVNSGDLDDWHGEGGWVTDTSAPDFIVIGGFAWAAPETKSVKLYYTVKGLEN